MRDKPDYVVQNEGTIFLVWPQNLAAREWLAEHVPDDAQWWGDGAIVVEHRYIADFVAHLQSDGFSVI
jgi:hypothetical protein